MVFSRISPKIVGLMVVMIQAVNVPPFSAVMAHVRSGKTVSLVHKTVLVRGAKRATLPPQSAWTPTPTVVTERVTQPKVRVARVVLPIVSVPLIRSVMPKRLLVSPPQNCVVTVPVMLRKVKTVLLAPVIVSALQGKGVTMDSVKFSVATVSASVAKTKIARLVLLTVSATPAKSVTLDSASQTFAVVMAIAMTARAKTAKHVHKIVSATVVNSVPTVCVL